MLMILAAIECICLSDGKREVQERCQEPFDIFCCSVGLDLIR